MYRILTAVLLLFLCAGCSYYSVSGSLPGHIKTAAVPLFENKTVEAGIVEDLTDAIEAAIIKNGNMKITGEFQADAVVKGTIVELIDEADTFSKSESAKQFKIRIFADVQFFDRVKNKAIWEENKMEGWARYDASGSSGSDGLTREEAISEALKMLAEKIIDNTVSGW
ncbi:LPS assembly lipoprotein LptE [bacterium]|nr:LPS assembly lipoprotein LptE [bacterium]